MNQYICVMLNLKATKRLITEFEWRKNKLIYQLENKSSIIQKVIEN